MVSTTELQGKWGGLSSLDSLTHSRSYLTCHQTVSGRTGLD